MRLQSVDWLATERFSTRVCRCNSQTAATTRWVRCTVVHLPFTRALFCTVILTYVPMLNSLSRLVAIGKSAFHAAAAGYYRRNSHRAVVDASSEAVDVEILVNYARKIVCCHVLFLLGEHYKTSLAGHIACEPFAGRLRYRRRHYPDGTRLRRAAAADAAAASPLICREA